MTLEQLLDALRPYGVDLSYSPVACVWCVILFDWAFAHYEAAEPTAALAAAWEAVQGETVSA